jgi:hypothetical protein
MRNIYLVKIFLLNEIVYYFIMKRVNKTKFMYIFEL